MANDTQPLTVYFSLSLLQIMDVVSPRASPRGAPGRGARPLPRASSSPPADHLRRGTSSAAKLGAAAPPAGTQ